MTKKKLREIKEDSRESAVERFRQEYPDLDYKVGKQSVEVQGEESASVVTEIIILRQKVSYGDQWW